MNVGLACQLLQSRGMKRLPSLTLWSYNRRLIELACQLPLLATLRLECPLAAADGLLLSAARSHTDLTVTHAAADRGCFSSVLRCPKLRRLGLEVSGFRVADLQAFSQEPGWQQLRELVLTPMNTWDQLSADTFAAALSSLRSLLVLQLTGENFDPLLAHVHRIPGLRRLIIECGCWCEDCPTRIMCCWRCCAPILCCASNGPPLRRARSFWNRCCSRWSRNWVGH